jgi:hypothetical protein
MQTVKKTSLILVLLFSFNLSFSQSRLGYKLNEVCDEFSSSEYPVRDLGKNHGVGYHFYVQTSVGNVAYYSDIDSVVTQTIVVPKNKEVWDYLIKEYNTNAKKIDEKSWVYCFDDIESACLVEIINDENDTIYKIKGEYIKTSYTKY